MRTGWKTRPSAGETCGCWLRNAISEVGTTKGRGGVAGWGGSQMWTGIL